MGGQLGFVENSVGFEGQAILTEAKVGGQADIAGAKITAGVSLTIGVGGGATIGQGKFKGRAKLGIGFEIDIDLTGPDLDPVKLDLGQGSSPGYFPPTRDIVKDYPDLPPNAVKVLLIHYAQALGWSPPPPPKRPYARTIDKPSVHGCAFGPDGPGPHGKAYPGGSPLR